jgi:hypothetical protein
MHFLQPVQPTVLKIELSQHSFHKMYNADNLRSVFLETTHHSVQGPTQIPPLISIISLCLSAIGHQNRGRNWTPPLLSVSTYRYAVP